MVIDLGEIDQAEIDLCREHVSDMVEGWSGSVDVLVMILAELVDEYLEEFGEREH